MISEMMGGRIALPEQQATNAEEKALGNVDLGGAKMSSWEILK